MKITEETRQRGKELAGELKASVLFVNDKNEFFTSENLASLSVSGNKAKFQKLDFVIQETKDLEVTIEVIEGLETIEEVQAILDAEIIGAGDAAIMDACEARIAELKKDAE